MAKMGIKMKIMEDQNWDEQFEWTDLNQQLYGLVEEEVYTIYMADFFKMPDVDFKELAQLDPYVRALFN